MNQQHDHDHHHDHSHAFSRVEGLRIGFVFLALAFSWFGLWQPYFHYNYIGCIAAIIGAYPIFKEALSALLERKMTMELSMTIALAAAMAIGEVFTALLITLFVLIAEVLEGMTVDRGRRAIEALLDLMPKDAYIRQKNIEHKASIADLQQGDIVIVKPGTRIPVDGRVIRGATFIDQSAITGESLPVEKIPGSEVFAGTINQSGAIDVETMRVGKDTAFGKIIQAVEAAEKSRAPIQKIADRLSGYLVYFAISAAILTYLLTHDIRSTISVIIVAGACGVAAGTPLAILGAIGRAASQGAIVKGGLYLEELGRINTVVFDKTGTLTYGEPEVADIIPACGVSQEAVLEAAAIAERLSEHAIARAILKKAAEKKLPVIEPERFEYFPGKGIICWLNGDSISVGNATLMKSRQVDTRAIPSGNSHLSEIYIARNNELLGIMKIADVIRPEAAEAVKRLHQMNLKTILMTGDTANIANAIGGKLNITNIESGLLPEEKAGRIQAMMQSGARIAMVGDGINDAPALVQANIGVAMGSGTDVARESADIVLLGNDLGRFVETVQVSKRCRNIIFANFIGTLLVDAIGIVLAGCGFLNPPVAALIHVSSELIFIMNSARLLPAQTRKIVVENDPVQYQSQTPDLSSS